MRAVMTVLIVIGGGVRLDAVQFFCYPSPAVHGSSGAAIFVGGVTGDFRIRIWLEHLGEIKYENEIDAYHFSTEIGRPIAVWPLTDKYGKPIGTGSLSAHLRMTNLTNGDTHAEGMTVGVKSGAASPMSQLGVETLTGPYSDVVYHFHPTGNAGRKRAIVFFEGFDPFNVNGFMGEAFYMHTLWLGDNPPRAQGWDIYLVDWQDGGAAISTNAARATKILQQIHVDGPYEEMVLIGYSMGGVIARLALLNEERSGNPLPVDKFVALDSPQQGANQNLTLQAAFVYLDGGSFSVNLGKFLHLAAAMGVPMAMDMLFSGAAKDMLYYHVSKGGTVRLSVNWECPLFECPQNLDSDRESASSLHDEFYNNYIKGEMPQETKNYAITYSNGDMKYQDKTRNEHMGNLHAGGTPKIYSGPWDLEPGSYIDWAEQSDDAYDGTGGWDGKLVFIPLESALDLRTPPNKVGGRMTRKLSDAELQQCSAFDHVFTRTKYTQEHTDLPDDEIGEYLLWILNDTSGKPSKPTSAASLSTLQY